MVGMSGKNSEPRTSGGGHKKHHTPHNKPQPQPPVEALQMAQILEDTHYPKNAAEKVQEILTVVPGRSEEEVFFALHDHDFDPEKAISALLDNDGGLGQGGWTTTGSRKGKKKGGQSDSIDVIVAPGDSKSKSGKTSKSTNRAASQSTREGYGGNVHITSSGESRGGKGAGRGRSQGGGRKTRTSIGERRNRGREGREGRERGNRSKPLPQSSAQGPTGEMEMWNTVPTGTTDNTVHVDAWLPPDSTPIPTSNKIESYWEDEDEPPLQRQPPQPQLQQQQHAVFPEALPSSNAVAVSTPAETTPPLLSTATTIDRDTNVQVVLDQKDGQTELSSTKPSGSKRAKRLARSQIPTKPVEMPAGIESLDAQFGQLGIDFGGLESEDVPVSVNTPTKTDQLVTETAPNDMNSLLGSYDAKVQRLSEDPGVISVGQSAIGDTSYRTEQLEVSNTASEEEKPLEGPPGLTHPTTSNHEPTDMSALISTSTAPPAPIELPHQTTASQSHSFSVTSGSSGGDLLLSASTIASTVSLSSGSTRTSSHTAQHSTATQSATQGKHGGSSGTVPPGMMYPGPTMVPAQFPYSMMAAPMYPNYGDPSDMSRYPASAVSMAYYTSSSDPSIAGGLSGRDHSTSSFQEPAKFGHGSDVTSPISSNPSQQAIQQQQGLQQGQQMGPHFYPYGSMFYPAMYHMPGFSHSLGPKPSGPGTGSTYPGVSSYQPPHQGNYALSNYEDLGAAHDFSKMYSTSSLNKSTVLPTTSGGGSDIQSGGSSSSFKHFDSTKSGNYNYNMPQVGGSQGAGYMTGAAAAAYMQMPTMAPVHHMAPVMPTGGHDASSQLQPNRASQKHSSKASGYNPSTAGFWSQGSHS